MKTCTTCQTPKREIDFPYAANTVCLPCHRENAMRWKELPWEDGRLRKTSEAQKEHLKQLRLRSKRPSSRVKSPLDSTEALPNEENHE